MNMYYAMVRKVVIPAITSVFILCFDGSKPKSFSNMTIFFLLYCYIPCCMKRCFASASYSVPGLP